MNSTNNRGVKRSTKNLNDQNLQSDINFNDDEVISSQASENVSDIETKAEIEIDLQFEKSPESGTTIKLEDSKLEQNISYQQRHNNQNNSEEYVVNIDKILKLKYLLSLNFDDLINVAHEYSVLNLNRMLKNDIIVNILKQAMLRSESIFYEGILEIVDDGFGFIRYVENNYVNCAYDVFLSQNQIRKFGLRKGDILTGYLKEPKKGERYFALALISTINDKEIKDIRNKPNFDNSTPIHPQDKFNFGFGGIVPRAIDLISPIAKGQRALIVAPPRVGKTMMLQSIAHAVNEYHPEVELIYLGIDERPEELTEMKRTIKRGEVVGSTFDEPAYRHIALAEMVIEKSKRMVENGKDVLILLDSITRLARAYNVAMPSSGKVLTGGVDANALQKPKRFFGAARNIEHGGSLTIIATALVDTGSKMDEVIFEEFKGTGNSEIVLDRKMSDKRLFPAIDILKSGTRKEDEMMDKDSLSKIWILRRLLIQMNNNNQSSESLEFLLQKIKESSNNADLLLKMNMR